MRREGIAVTAQNTDGALKVRTVFFAVGIIFVLLFLVRNDSISGHVCVSDWCVGTLNGGLHAGSEASFGATGLEQP